jgi:hypothetical protein
MKTSNTYLVVCALLGLPSCVAYGESADSRYCEALADTYLDLVGHDDLSPGTTSNPVAIAVAMEKCKTDPAYSIPIIEQALKNAKINLPPRT